MEAEPSELLTGGEEAQAKEPEAAREAKGEEAEPSRLTGSPGGEGGEEGERRGGAGD